MQAVLLLLCLLYIADATAVTIKEDKSRPVTTFEPVITTQANTTQSVFGPVNITLFGPSDKIPRHATNVIFTCSAMGNPQLDFEWINTPTGASVTPVSDLGHFTYSQAISFNPRNFKDDDVIECKATNPVLKDASLKATYRFRFTIGPVNITLFGPSDKIPRHATNVIFTCSAMGNPQLDFEWINTPTGASVTPVSDLGHFTYSQAISFNPRNFKDDDVIECKATNPVLKDASLKATYRFRFTREAELINCIKPPKYVTTRDTTPCTCSFLLPYGAPNNWTIQWADPSGKILASHTSVHDTLTLPLQASYIKPQHRGLPFNCMVSNLQGEHSRVQYTPRVAYGPENVTLSGPKEKIAQDGSYVNLTCTATSSPAPRFFWGNKPKTFRLLPVQKLAKDTFSQTLTFNSSGDLKDDVIKCRVRNPERPGVVRTAEYHLQFREASKAPLVKCIQEPHRISTNHTHACTCSFTPPDFPYTLTWTLTWTDPRGKVLVSQASSLKDTLTLPLPTSLIQPQDSGKPFVCVVSNERGEYSRTTNYPFRPYGPENVTLSGPKEKIAQDGSYVNLTCTATSSPAPRFFWGNKPKTFRLLPVQKLCKDTFSQTLTFNSSGDLKDDVIKCRVRNPVRPGVVRTAEYHLQFREASNGPTNVFMLTGTYDDPVKGSYIILTCLADSRSHALIFEWGGLPGSATPFGCSFETGFSCQTVTFPADAVPDDQSVSCSVLNPDMPEQTKNASFVAGSPMSYATFGYATLVGAGAAAAVMAGGLGVYGAARMSSKAKTWPTKSSSSSSAPSSKSPSKSETILSKANRFLTGKKSQKEKKKESKEATPSQQLPLAIDSARPESSVEKREACLEIKGEEVVEDMIYEATFPTLATVPKAKNSAIEESPYEGIEKYLGISRPTETDAGLTTSGITSMVSHVYPQGVPGIDEGKLGEMSQQAAEVAGSVVKSPIVKVAATGVMAATGLSTVQGVAEVVAGGMQAVTADSEAKDPISKSIPGHLMAATVASASAAQGDVLGRIGGTLGISESEKTDPISKTFAAGHVLGVKGEGSTSGGLLGKIGESVGVTGAEEKGPVLKTISGTLSGSERGGTSHGGILGQTEGALGGVWGSSGASLFTGKPGTKG